MLRVADKLRESWRAVAAALLLVIGIHAAAPVGQPLQRQAGSAFSAATADVSLSQTRRAGVTKRQVARNALPPRRIVLALAMTQAPEADAGFAAYDANAPPLTRLSFSPLAPRAPPAA